MFKIAEELMKKIEDALVVNQLALEGNNGPKIMAACVLNCSNTCGGGCKGNCTGSCHGQSR